MSYSDEIKKIQIADIACGSGIFLEEAYQFLVDYCTEWYMQHDSKHLLELSNGKKKLPLTDKKDILTKKEIVRLVNLVNNPSYTHLEDAETSASIPTLKGVM